jgi:hypothetical protein
MYATCFNPLAGAASGAAAYAEQVCTYTAPSPFGPWVRDELGSPAVMSIAGRMHSHENLTTLVRKLGGGTLVSGTVDVDTSWTRAGSPYRLDGIVEVSSGATLAIDPGVVVKARPGASLDVLGTLRALGTAAERVLFSSDLDDAAGGDSNDDGAASAPAPRDWGGIRLLSGSAANELEFVELRFAGAGGAATLAAEAAELRLADAVIRDGGDVGLAITSAAPAISNSRIETHGIGVRLVGATAQLTGSTLSANAIGVEAEQDAGSVLSGNTIAGNGVLGASNLTPAVVLNAMANDWGDPSGPLDASDDTATGGFYNPTGLGDAVSDGVDYSGWIGSAPPP